MIIFFKAFNLTKPTEQNNEDLQGFSAGVLLTVIDWQLKPDNRWIHAGVHDSEAQAVIVLSIHSQTCVIEASPLSCALIHLQRDDIGPTVHGQVTVDCR